MAASKKAEWDAPENEANNSFVSWGKEGDFILGTLVNKKQVKSTLPDRAGQMQPVYEFKVKECSYHVLDDKKKVVEEAVEPEEGSIVSVGGRSTIDSRMAHAKLGQVVGLKFIEEQPSKTKGYNPTKVIKVYFPKNSDGTIEMDEEWVKEQEAADDGFGN